MTRRGFVLGGAFVAGASAGGAAVSLLGSSPLRKAPPRAVPPAKPGPVRAATELAVSLREFQRELNGALSAGGVLPVDLRQLHGLNCIDGILAEPDKDVVLAGAHDPTLPPIELDDLLVVLRNAYSVSDAYSGAPGCSTRW